MNVNTEQEAVQYLEERGARVVRVLDVLETLEVRWAVFRAIALHMDCPLDFTGSIQHDRGVHHERTMTFYWDHLAPPNVCADESELSELLKGEDQLLVMFEACRVPVLVAERGALSVASLEGEDVYLLPIDKRWVVVTTHEAECGPYKLGSR